MTTHKYKWQAASWESRLWATYALTRNDYNKLFTAQEGKCAICQKHQSEFKRTFAVDHSHITGAIRGLLCASCNSALGFSKDSVFILKRMISYLESK